ncbi:late competence development ComFB family protein [Bacillus gobiensis]|uniref:late competence development ComFB family protein n=1 Tax=Bacillus gobiensis TaxID=1441095 RepID=UPI003D1FB937
MLINAKEVVFKALLHQYVDDLNMPCTCEKCLDGVMAISLNNVKPKYISDSDKLAFVTSDLVDRQTKTSLLVILVEAAAIVSKSPHCKWKEI